MNILSDGSTPKKIFECFVAKFAKSSQASLAFI